MKTIYDRIELIKEKLENAKMMQDECRERKMEREEGFFGGCIMSFEDELMWLSLLNFANNIIPKII